MDNCKIQMYLMVDEDHQIFCGAFSQCFHRHCAIRWQEAVCWPWRVSPDTCYNGMCDPGETPDNCPTFFMRVYLIKIFIQIYLVCNDGSNWLLKKMRQLYHGKAKQLVMISLVRIGDAIFGHHIRIGNFGLVTILLKIAIQIQMYSHATVCIFYKLTLSVNFSTYLLISHRIWDAEDREC